MDYWFKPIRCRDKKNLLIIRNKKGKIAVEMKLSTYDQININKLDMMFKGFKIVADEKCFKVSTPVSKGTVNHTGSIFADIGVLLKQDGRALIAANRNGVAAICIG